ncbi:hypothetical protein JBE04_12815 [Streptomyces sp. PRKS01-29]|nr:hypothetical protein [Streptomyces sabulosicollis]MBI0295322.1 hypothetical protein [Streptomyces sabulosicollis]
MSNWRGSSRTPPTIVAAATSCPNRRWRMRFICCGADCPRRPFAEPFTRLAAPYAGGTTWLDHVLERVGLALAGRASARLADQLLLRAGRVTWLGPGQTGQPIHRSLIAYDH